MSVYTLINNRSDFHKLLSMLLVFSTSFLSIIWNMTVWRCLISNSCPLKKLNLDHLSLIWVLCQTLSYIPFEAFLSGIFVHLPTHYIASKSLEIFKALPNNWLDLIRKLSLIHSWCTGERFLEFICGSHILSLSFMRLIFERLQILTKLPETLQKWLSELFVYEKT